MNDEAIDKILCKLELDHTDDNRAAIKRIIDLWNKTHHTQQITFKLQNNTEIVYDVGEVLAKMIHTDT